MRPWDQHLDSDELDQLVWPEDAADGALGRLSHEALGEARRHLESCQVCHRKVQMHRSVQNELSAMALPQNVPSGRDCSPYAEWLRVAAGLLSETDAMKRMTHAADCRHCGPLLQKAAEVVAEDTTPGEEQVLSTLRSADAHRQEQIANELLRTVHAREAEKPAAPWWSGLHLGWSGLLAGAAAALIALAVWLAWPRTGPESAEGLLAEAYTENRPFDARIPGAKFAPFQSERAAEQSSFARPSSLAHAEALISDHSGDPTWFQAKARADLLDRHYQAAIDSLLKVQEMQPQAPGLLLDLGTAYYLSGTLDKNLVDLSRSVDTLKTALRGSPDDAVVLFNLALACEAMQAYDCAIETSQRYLQVDPAGKWSDEVRGRLTKLQNRKQGRIDQILRPLMTPEQIAAAEPVALREAMDKRFEEYLKQAIVQWLPAAFTAPPSDATREAQTALRVLSELSRERHGDTWLQDLLSASPQPQFATALQALAIAVKADEEGDNAEAHKAAVQASELFHAVGNQAGAARGEAEQAYSDQILWEGQRCLDMARKVEQDAEAHQWPWLRAQMWLEQSNCANQVGDMGAYEQALTKGVSEANAHHLRASWLRGFGFQALAAASFGDSEKALALTAQGLTEFWSGEGTLMNGYNLYANLDPAVDNLHLTNLQVVLWQEAAGLIDHHSDIKLRATAHQWYGKAAYEANIPTLAAREFSNAGALFKRCPQTIATARDYLDAEVWLANAEIRQGDLNTADATLQGIKPMLEQVDSLDPEIGFYSAQADLALKRGDAPASESAIRSAVFLSDWSLRSLTAAEDRRQWAQQSRGAYADAVEWKLRQGDARAALELWERYRGAEYDDTHDGTALVTPAVIKAPPDPRQAPALPAPAVVSNRLALLRSETVLTYVTLPDGVVVWTYDDRGIVARRIRMSSTTLQAITAQFARLCRDRRSDLNVLRKSGAALYEALIAPVEDRLVAGRVLVFEPDGFLEAIPWEALVDARGHYLCQDFPIVVSPGLYRSAHLRPAAAITSATSALVISVPVVAQDDLSTLPDADREAEAVSRQIPSARWLQGNAATISAVHDQLPAAEVFHFAGHAVDSQGRGGLLLAESDPESGRALVLDGESFHAEDTHRLQLVVLSACHTGAQPEAGASGTEGLAQQFLSYGVPHVVVSRWNIDSSKTADYMAQFYTKLLSGVDTARAMQSAELLLASQPNSAHPYFWAAFELEGTI